MVNEAHRVLVLEDHDFQRRVAVKLLEDCGVSEVFEAPSSGEALRLMRAQPIDVLLCDLQMPGMDGVELIRHVAEGRLARSVIIASALEPALIGTVAEMAKAHGLQVLGAIEKPITADKLKALLGAYRASGTGRPAERAVRVTPPEIETGIRGAQFEPYFQPQVTVATRKVVGAEALIYWHHPERGLIGPTAFIPIAEDTPVMAQLTWMMLGRSLAQRSSWAERGLQLSVSVNFSADVLSQVGVADRVAAMATEHGVDPRQVILEVTESTVARNDAHMLETLARLRMKGFGLAIDDYGTGYSSMQQLSRIPFTEVKLDRSLVHGASMRTQLRAILQSSLELARRLKLTSVAEGVEQREDWDLLVELGCDVGQGYFISKALPGGAIEPWIETWSRSTA